MKQGCDPIIPLFKSDFVSLTDEIEAKPILLVNSAHPTVNISHCSTQIQDQPEFDSKSKDVTTHQIKCKRTTKEWSDNLFFTIKSTVQSGLKEHEDLVEREKIIDKAALEIHSKDKHQSATAKKIILQQISLIKTDNQKQEQRNGEVHSKILAFKNEVDHLLPPFHNFYQQYTDAQAQVNAIMWDNKEIVKNTLTKKALFVKLKFIFLVLAFVGFGMSIAILVQSKGDITQLTNPFVFWFGMTLDFLSIAYLGSYKYILGLFAQKIKDCEAVIEQQALILSGMVNCFKEVVSLEKRLSSISQNSLDVLKILFSAKQNRIKALKALDHAVIKIMTQPKAIHSIDYAYESIGQEMSSL
eukprot:Awhi_evm1s8448